ncbi:MAG: CHAD domain-containing protein, partial [Gammaproteobacteria bacterium]|nr:CHAD domain-containing protein [Gammaproteobacteria bacterium]
PPGLALKELALHELTAAREQLARSGSDRHEGVHQARKALRRIRAALALGRKPLGGRGKRLDADLASLCRGLSPLRDAEALVETLQRLVATAPETLRGELPELIRQARDRRDQRLGMVLDRDPGLKRRRARLKALAARLARLDWAQIDQQSVAAAVAHSERRLGSARERIVRHPGEDDRWHTLRRRLRRLHQQHNLLRRIAPAWPADMHATSEEATRLGEAQDDVLLLRHCGRNSPFAARSRAGLRALASERLERVRAVTCQADMHTHVYDSRRKIPQR